jgi:hypothetical protein
VVDRRAYLAAVSHGIDATGADADADRAESPLRLLATATTRTPALLLAAAVLDDGEGLGDGSWERERGRRVIRTLSSGLVRTAHHALEVHARDTGYDPGAWIAQAVTLASMLADEQAEDPTRVLAATQDAADRLADAIVALSCDRMAFPDHLAQAQAAWLACWCCARN